LIGHAIVVFVPFLFAGILFCQKSRKLPHQQAGKQMGNAGRAGFLQ